MVAKLLFISKTDMSPDKNQRLSIIHHIMATGQGGFMRSFFLMITAFILALFTPFAAIAQVEPVVSNESFWMMLWQQVAPMIGSKPGVLAIVAVVVQILLKFLSTPMFGQFFKNVTGPMKLLIVSGLTVVGGVVALMSGGLDLGAALVDSANLAAITVFLNQLYKQFVEKKA